MERQGAALELGGSLVVSSTVGSTTAWRQEHCSLAMTNGAAKLATMACSLVLEWVKRGEGRDEEIISRSILHGLHGLVSVLIRIWEEQGGAHHLLDRMLEQDFILNFCDLFS